MSRAIAFFGRHPLLGYAVTLLLMALALFLCLAIPGYAEDFSSMLSGH